jgi:multidrug resistance efflux pump
MLRSDAPAATLLERGELYVRIYVPETQIGKIQVGQQVPISVDSFPKRQFHGRVDHINEVGEYTPRRLITTEDRSSEVFGARIALDDGIDDLRAGMIAFIHVPKR